MPAARPEVRAFFDEPTFTVSYLAWDPASKRAAIIDSVLDFDAKSGRTGTQSAQALIDAAEADGLTIDWILETHAHADHLSAAPFLRQKTGAPIVIGSHIKDVQAVFKKVFNLDDIVPDGRPFSRIVDDGERLALGALEIEVMHTPGHTPACVTYKIGDAVFVGDTLFMPDYGTARCDFPGGDARTLYRSIQRILELPRETRMFLCHDYKAPGRDVYEWQTTVGAQRDGNVHIREGVSEEAFVAMREARDKTLAMPVLILPSIQVNIRAGELPPAESNGVRYLKLPLDAL
ncbi:MAG: MBL fold metallo-hydrolase [Hyphomonadaceae bacterium]|nr:MBL fold metallo-hydrolase [Hyphomonadaceae bacterium]MBX3509642.1 MBL fold metallo-hydrolase [Hyphomonadaceae bacterium]